MYRLRWLAALVIMLSFFTELRATHITGAELTYQCVNAANRVYQFKLTMYRDCANGQAGFDNNVRLFIFRGNNNTLYTTVNVSLTQTGIQLLPVKWDACTGAPYNLCVEYVDYIVNVTLPNQVGGYNVGWARCCRNNVVTNISVNQGITVLAKVPGITVPGCNSMPTFNQLPPLFLCAGQPFVFDHSATDPDGDSLVYKISNPYTGVNSTGQGATQFNPVVNVGGPFGGNPMGPPPYNNINYLAGYSFTDPFGSGNFAIDPTSGLLTLTPTQAGLSVFALSVCEYKNGVLLSENKRDFQINVINCSPQGQSPNISNNTVPTPGSNGDTIWVKPTESFCYDVTVTDSAASDTVVLFPASAAFGIGGTTPPPYATLTYTGINPAVGHVCWEAPCYFAGDTVLLIVGGQDTSDCPGYNIVFDTTYVIVEQLAQPTISHQFPNVNGTDTLVVTANDSICYDVFGFDVDAMDTLELFPVSGPFASLGGSAPFANLTFSGTNPVIGQVCWRVPCIPEGDTITFEVGVRDTNYCGYKAVNEIYMIIQPMPPVSAGQGDTLCVGESANLLASGGVSYLWYPNIGLNNVNIANPVATPLVTTRYYVDITDTTGCVRTDSIDIVVNPLPNANAGPDTVKCPGIPVQLQATGGIIYSWTPTGTLNDPNIPNPLADPLVATTYTVTVTDTNGCVNTDPVTITPMYAVAGADEAICIGDSVMISASGGITYSWSPTVGLSNPNIANPMASPTVTTTYTVTVTDITGCVDTDQLTVTVNPLPNANAGVDTDICIGNSTLLSASGGVSYVWTPGTGLNNPAVSTPTANPVVTTTYTVTVTDVNNCVASDDVTITVNPVPVIDAGNDTLKCGNTGIQLQASLNPNYVYNWTPALGLNLTDISNPIANPDSTTMYYVTVTDQNGCMNTDSILVTVVHADAGPDFTICIFDSVQLQGANGVAYSWDNGGSLSNPNIANPFASPLVTTTYTLTITSTTGCIDTDQMTVVVNPLPNADAGADQPLCIGDTTNLNASGGVSYVWNPDPTLIGTNIPNPAVFPTSTSSYIVTVTDANGCVNVDTTTVVVNPLPIVDAGNDTAKCGEVGVMLTATGGVAYQWTPALGLDNPNISTPIANPDSSTMYYVTVTDANQCSNIDSVFVRTMYANAGPDVPVCIFDSIQLSASGGIAYQWDPSPDLINGASATPTVFPQVNSDFYVTVTDITGCTDRDTVSVIVNPLPTTNTFGNDPYVCSGGGTVVNATGGNQYLWSPASVFNDSSLASPTAFPTYSGTTLDSTWRFYVTVTDSNGCVNYDSLDQVVRVLPIITISNDTVKCPNATVPLLLTGGVSYMWTPSIGLSDPLIANPTADPDSTTTYTGTVTAVWGCADSATVTVFVMEPDAGPDVTICRRDSVPLQGTGGVGFSWAPATGLSNPNIANPMASPDITTQYILTVTDSLGCVDFDTMVVTVNQLPPANAGADQAICIGDTAQLAATGGLSYAWFGNNLSNAFIPNTLANPSVTGDYIVAVTDGNSCTEFDTMTLTVNPLPLADAGPDLTKCGEDSIQLTATGGVNYLWSPNIDLSSNTIANPMAEPDSNFTYSVMVTDINGCINYDTLNIYTMYAEAGQPDTICFGDSIQLSASHIGGFITGYNWTPDSSIVNANISNPIVFPTITTNYIVTITDSSGCADTNAVEIYVHQAPPANAGPDTALCIGDSVMLMASGGIGYQWFPTIGLSDPNIASPMASPADTITYFVVVTDSNGCTAIDSMVLTVNPLPIVDAGADLTKCGEDSVQLLATGGEIYLWTPSTGLNDPNIFNPLASPDSTTMYTVMVTDSNGCVNYDSMTVSTMYADAGADQIKCPEDTVDLLATTIGGTPISYSWTPVASLTDPLIANPGAGPIVTTDYEVIITDISGCTDRDTMQVFVHAPPPANAGLDTSVCIGESAFLVASGGVSYSWTPAGTLSDANIFNPVATTDSTTEYIVTVTDANGCVERDSVVVTINPLPIVVAIVDTTICRRDAALLDATGATTYNWSPADFLTDPSVADPMAIPDSTITYTVTGIDDNGCVNTDQVTVNVWQLPEITADDYHEICLGQDITLSVEGGVGYVWSTGQQGDSIKVDPNNTTTYWAIPIGPNGCLGDTFYQEVYVERDLPEPLFTPSTDEGPYPLEVSFLNESNFSTNYIWDFGDGNFSDEMNPIHTFNEPGDFTVTLIADNDIGCPVELPFSFIKALDYRIFYPNAFTPNGDGSNDEFYIVNSSMEFFEIQIFNRWGQLIFQSNDPNFRWDGTRNGDPVAEGAYVYKVTATTFKGERIQRSGSVTLIR